MGQTLTDPFSCRSSFFSLKKKGIFLFFTRADETIQILKAFRDIYFHLL
jgi:hypothetical protein